MIIDNADMFEKPADLYIVTTNGVVLNDRLVMGAGSAQAAAWKYPGIEATAAAVIRRHAIRSMPVSGGAEHFTYGFVPIFPPAPGEAGLGIFQTKLDWRNAAKTDLIRLSADLLGEWLKDHPGLTVRAAFPGVGRGGLTVAMVEPFIRDLPVTWCRLEQPFQPLTDCANR